MTQQLLCWFLFSMASQSGVDSILTVIPENTAVIEGSPVHLQCATNTNEVRKGQWYHKPITAIGPETIRIFNSRRVINSSYSVRNEGERFDLIIKSSARSMAGQYICEEPRNETFSSAEVVILESDPKCLVRKPGNVSSGIDRVFSCSISFSGNWAPVMEWRYMETNELVPEAWVEHDLHPNINVTYTLYVPVNTSAMFGGFSCTTKFSNSTRNSSANATNVPTYIHIWNSTTEDRMMETYHNSTTLEYSTVVMISAGAAVGVSIIIAACVVMAIVLTRSSKYMIVSKSSSSEPDLYNSLNTTSTNRVCPVNEIPELHNGNCLPVVYEFERQRDCNSTKIVGEDGTEYVQININRPDVPPGQIRPIGNHSSNIYASIDHTIKA